MQQEEAKLKRYFYALVEKVKKFIGTRHPGFYVDTYKMFTHVMLKELPVDSWPRFVMDETFQRPHNWLKESMIRLINQRYFSASLKGDLDSLRAKALDLRRTSRRESLVLGGIAVE